MPAAEPAEASNLPPAQLLLEIEESAFKDSRSYVKALSALHGAGYALCLDGDGSADISLLEFASAPVASYRLSRHFLHLLLEEGMHGPARRFLMASMGAAQSIGANIIASGVDTPEVVTALQLVGVVLMQGEALAPVLEPDQGPATWAAVIKTR